MAFCLSVCNACIFVPYIDNPAYKGVWAPRKIKNPNYFEDKTPANFEPMGAVSNREHPV